MAASVQNVRVKLYFENDLIPDYQAPAFYWYLIEPQTQPTVTHIVVDLKRKFNLNSADFVLKVEDCIVPVWESSHIFRENDSVYVNCCNRLDNNTLAGNGDLQQKKERKKKKKQEKIESNEVDLESVLCVNSESVPDTVNSSAFDINHKVKKQKRKNSDTDDIVTQSIGESVTSKPKKIKEDAESTSSQLDYKQKYDLSDKETDANKIDTEDTSNSKKRKRKRKRNRNKNVSVSGAADQKPNEISWSSPSLRQNHEQYQISRNEPPVNKHKKRHIVFDSGDEMELASNSCNMPTTRASYTDHQRENSDETCMESPKYLQANNQQSVNVRLLKLSNPDALQPVVVRRASQFSQPASDSSSTQSILSRSINSPGSQRIGKIADGFQVFDRRKQKQTNVYEITKEQQQRSSQTNSSLVLQNGETSRSECEQIDDTAPPKDFTLFPPLLGPPREGDIIAYKVLELSDDYTPMVSNFKEARVLTYCPSDGSVKLEVLTRTEKKHNGRFDLTIEDESEVFTNVPNEDVVSIKFAELLEPRLIPAGP